MSRGTRRADPGAAATSGSAASTVGPGDDQPPGARALVDILKREEHAVRWINPPHASLRASIPRRLLGKRAAKQRLDVRRGIQIPAVVVGRLTTAVGSLHPSRECKIRGMTWRSDASGNPDGATKRSAGLVFYRESPCTRPAGERGIRDGGVAVRAVIANEPNHRVRPADVQRWSSGRGWVSTSADQAGQGQRDGRLDWSQHRILPE